MSIGYNAEFSQIHLSTLAHYRFMRTLDIRRLRGNHVSIPCHLLLLLLLPQLRLDLGHIMEPRVLESIDGTDPHLWTELEHVVQEVHPDGINLGHKLG